MISMSVCNILVHGGQDIQQSLTIIMT